MPETVQQREVAAEKAKTMKAGAAPITCHVCTRGEVDTFFEWSRKEGWRPGTNDADTFFAQGGNSIDILLA